MVRAAAVEATERGVRRVVWRFLTPDGQRWANEAEPSLERRLALVEWRAFDTMVGLLTAYAPLSDAELQELVSFLESPAGRWFAALYRDALLAAGQAAYERAQAALRGVPAGR